jgi:deoxyribodipyrimidine photo-lyase
VWVRRDLRLDDNPAWVAAATTHRDIVDLFVLDPRLMATAGVQRRRQITAEARLRCVADAVAENA